MNFKSVLLAIACLSVFSLAALPEIRITTLDDVDNKSRNGGSCQGAWTSSATSTHIFDYVGVTNFQLTDPNNPRNNITRTSKPDDAIRLRGNSTADREKKPYRIKFGEPVSLFDDVAAKSWVLLANFYDGTFALNAMAFELGKRLELKYTNSAWFVDLYINDQYKGIYQLTQQIQSHKGRVDLKESQKGWLVEFDYHAPASDECLSAFTTGKDRYNLTTFIKAPELDDTSFTKNPNDSTSLRFVKTDIMNLVNKMSESGFPSNGYRDLIDLESFAKYVLIQLVMDNFDFNSKTQTGGLPGSNYVYRKDSTSRIHAGPLWDFDLAAGVQNNMGGGMWGGGGTAGFPAHYQSYQDPVAPTSQNYSHAFYKRLWEDPVFKAKYKKTWDACKSEFQSMNAFIDQVKTQVEGSITGKGKNTWANNSMMGSGTLTAQQFNTEIANLKTWWTNRLNYVDQQLSNIDTSADPDPVTFCGGSSSSVVSSSSSSDEETTPILPKEGAITLSNIPKGAKVEVYNLQGKLVYSGYPENSKIPIKAKGMYIIKIRFGNSTPTYQNRIYLN